jgi:hypothetical protein
MNHYSIKLRFIIAKVLTIFLIELLKRITLDRRFALIVISLLHQNTARFC